MQGPINHSKCFFSSRFLRAEDGKASTCWMEADCNNYPLSIADIKENDISRGSGWTSCPKTLRPLSPYPEKWNLRFGNHSRSSCLPVCQLRKPTQQTTVYRRPLRNRLPLFQKKKRVLFCGIGQSWRVSHFGIKQKFDHKREGKRPKRIPDFYPTWMILDFFCPAPLGPKTSQLPLK